MSGLIRTYKYGSSFTLIHPRQAMASYNKLLLQRCENVKVPQIRSFNVAIPDVENRCVGRGWVLICVIY